MLKIVKDYNQFDPGSQLFKDIQAVTGCEDTEIQGIADGHCNLISFWALMKAAGHTDMTYQHYFKRMLDLGFCDVGGWVKAKKEVIAAKLFRYNFTPVFFEDFEDVVNPSTRLNPKSFYQIKIKNTDHYIACSVDTGKLLIYDTGRRGIGVSAIGADRIDQAHFKWLMEVPCA